ncbi:hypothetical protein [Candidatus Merdisoma sp. JLR.KK006]|uniref:hypothetical protein n=1 Tax=Candidatus Merdisoma sp. JLR.KK006 TaxID=3112626 RepID=UPI002FF3291F
MTHEEIHEIWNGLTDEQKAEAEAKKAEIIQWSVEQSWAIMEKLKKEGKLKPGLDTNYDNPELQQVSKEYKRRLNELLKEYGFEPIKKWEES